MSMADVKANVLSELKLTNDGVFVTLDTLEANLREDRGRLAEAMLTLCEEGYTYVTPTGGWALKSKFALDSESLLRHIGWVM